MKTTKEQRDVLRKTNKTGVVGPAGVSMLLDYIEELEAENERLRRVRKVAAEAVRAERERCAAIALEISKSHPGGFVSMGYDIADKIRNPQEGL